MVSTLRCGRNNPGSNPGHGSEKIVFIYLIIDIFPFSSYILDIFIFFLITFVFFLLYLGNTHDFFFFTYLPRYSFLFLFTYFTYFYIFSKYFCFLFIVFKTYEQLYIANEIEIFCDHDSVMLKQK